MSKYDGARWIEANRYCKALSPLGIVAADFLGDVYLGIYHIDQRTLSRVDWSNPQLIEIMLYGYLSTFDSDILTRMVLLAHDRLLRLEFRGTGPGYIRLMITQRKSRDGSLFDRCPTMEEHVALLRGHYGEPQP